MFKSIEQLMT